MPSPIVVPRLNENDDEVVVTDLLVADGGKALAGNGLFGVETTKSTNEIVAEVSGYVLWIVCEKESVPVLGTIGFICDTVEELDRVRFDLVNGANELEVNPFLPKTAIAAAGEPARKVTRAATQLAADLGVDLGRIQVHGIIQEKHVRNFIATTGPTSPPSPRDEAPSRRMPRGDIETDPEGPSGKIDVNLLDKIRRAPQEFGALPSDAKVEMYREHGAVIGDDVSIGEGTVLIADHLMLGADTTLGKDIQVNCHRFVLGQLCRVGDNCRFFCRHFVAGDVVTLRWNVAIVDGQGGIHDCRIGDLSFVAYDTYLNTDRDVTLGERVCLSPGVRLYTHRKWLDATQGYPFAYAAVVIGDRCWLGPNSIVLPGVSLAEGVTLMPNAVATNNAPPSALLGGSPATVVVANQRRELSPQQLQRVLVEILENNEPSLERLGWTVKTRDPGNCICARCYSDGFLDAEILACETPQDLPADLLHSKNRLIAVLVRGARGLELRDGFTIFDLESGLVVGTRDAASDVVRHLFLKYGVLFEPRLWRLGCRLEERTYTSEGKGSECDPQS